ncbi:MAG: VacJ family lipoprotein [Alphaproteobacteria bacterium]
MKKKVLFAFTAVLMSSLCGGALQADDIKISDSAENHAELEDGQGPPRDPLDDDGGADDASSSEEVFDPLEPLNRCIFVLNQMIDGLILRPISIVYDSVLPEPVKESVANVLSNLWEPVSFINYLLQGNPNEAGVAITRFAINSTVGLVGIIDIARKMDVPGENTGFSDTLSVWGIGAGPYIMIPLLGPSTFRGAVGLAADYFADPINYYLIHKRDEKWLVYTRTGLEIIDNRYRLLEILDDLQANSVDYYAAIRSIHLQKIDYKKQQHSSKE